MKPLNLIIAALLLLSVAFPAVADTSTTYTRTSASQSMSTFVPTTGATITLPRSNDTVAIVNAAGTIATLTVTMPPSPKDGDYATITSIQTVSAVTFTGGTVTNAPTSISANASVGFVYSSALGTWNQKGGDGGAAGLDRILGISGAVQGAVVRLTSGAYSLATSTCGLFASATTCATVLGYADPRAFGASCAGNTSIDDSAGIQAAINTNKPVLIPGVCTIVNKLNFSNDGQTIFSFGSGGRYNSNYPGSSPYLFVNNGLWDNRATSLNCAIDTNGYDNVTVKNLAIRANFGLVGSVAMCNSTGIRSPRSAAFLNIQDVSCLNIGNCVGAAMVSYFDDNPSNPGTPYGGNTPCTPISTQLAGYGAGVVGIHNNVFQVRAKGLDMIGSCMGMYGNFSDFHMTDFYGAALMHNVVASLAGFGSAWEFNNGRVEYSGYGSNATPKVYFNDGAGLYFDSVFGIGVTNLTCDHQYGTCMTAGPNSRNINWNNIVSIDSGYTNAAGITDKSHFAILGTRGLSATNIVTRRNAVATPYVLTVRGTNTYVRWQGTGGTSGAGAGPGGWANSYFNFVTTPTQFTYDVLGVGYYSDTAAALLDLTTTTVSSVLFDAGNSGTAKTISLANGMVQKLTLTGNVTVTMPAQPTAGSSRIFNLRVYTGSGSFTATFTGVKWAGGVAPTITATAARLDVLRFESDGVNWYGSVIGQNYTP